MKALVVYESLFGNTEQVAPLRQMRERSSGPAGWVDCVATWLCSFTFSRTDRPRLVPRPERQPRSAVHADRGWMNPSRERSTATASRRNVDTDRPRAGHDPVS